MKFATMVLVLVLSACYFCLFPPQAFAQQKIPANNPLDLNGQWQTGDAVDAGQDLDLTRQDTQIEELRNQLKGLRSARDSVARARIGELEERLQALEDAKARLPADLVGRAEVVVMIDDAIKAAARDSPAPPSDAPGTVQPAARGFNFDQKLKDLEDALSVRIAGLWAEIYALNDRLRRRAIRFDAAFWTSVHHGGEALGGLGAVVWPLGQDGDWALRSAFGVGQNYYLSDGERYGSIGLLAKADLLYRGDSISAGPTALAQLGVVRSGIRFLYWGAGVTVRVEAASWIFFQASATVGRAMSTFAPLQWGYGGAGEVGIPF